jgi:predicted NUDIX family phosphoesterase
VLCVSRDALLTILGGRRGFVPLPKSQLMTLLDPAGPNGWVAREKGPGGLEDPQGQGKRWVQVVPYALFTDGGDPPRRGPACWVYRRSGGGEARLEGMLSLGVGGHVEHDADNGSGNLMVAVHHALHREVAEEVSWLPLPTGRGPDYRGVLFLDGPGDPPVNHVHLGVVFSLPALRVAAKPDQGLEEVGWTTAGTLTVARADFEPWSRALIEGLVAKT